MRQFLNELLFDQTVRKIEMLRDNKTSFILIKNPESQNCTKHINVIYYYIQKLVDDRELGMK